MDAAGRWRVALGAVTAAGMVVACGAAPGPDRPSPQPTASVSPGPSSPASSTPATSSASSPEVSGLTLRQLGFENGPLDEFSLPSDLVVATRVDQPNVVTIVLARPSPGTVEDYLRASLPGEGFTIGARADAGQAMTFTGNGWTGGFTGTDATSAIVLRPA